MVLYITLYSYFSPTNKKQTFLKQYKTKQNQTKHKHKKASTQNAKPNQDQAKHLRTLWKELAEFSYVLLRQF